MFSHLLLSPPQKKNPQKTSLILSWTSCILVSSFFSDGLSKQHDQAKAIMTCIFRPLCLANHAKTVRYSSSLTGAKSSVSLWEYVGSSPGLSQCCSERLAIWEHKPCWHPIQAESHENSAAYLGCEPFWFG
jgi:hypothetical protein